MQILIQLNDCLVASISPNGIERRTVEAIVDYINGEVSKTNETPTVIIRATDIFDSKD